MVGIGDAENGRTVVQPVELLKLNAGMHAETFSRFELVGEVIPFYGLYDPLKFADLVGGMSMSGQKELHDVLAQDNVHEHGTKVIPFYGLYDPLKFADSVGGMFISGGKDLQDVAVEDNVHEHVTKVVAIRRRRIRRTRVASAPSPHRSLAVVNLEYLPEAKIPKNDDTITGILFKELLIASVLYIEHLEQVIHVYGCAGPLKFAVLAGCMSIAGKRELQDVLDEDNFQEDWRKVIHVCGTDDPLKFADFAGCMSIAGKKELQDVSVEDNVQEEGALPVVSTPSRGLPFVTVVTLEAPLGIAEGSANR